MVQLTVDNIGIVCETVVGVLATLLLQFAVPELGVLGHTVEFTTISGLSVSSVGHVKTLKRLQRGSFSIKLKQMQIEFKTKIQRLEWFPKESTPMNEVVWFAESFHHVTK